MYLFDFHEPLLSAKFRISAKFPGTAWQVIHSRQAAHNAGMFSGFLRGTAWR